MKKFAALAAFVLAFALEGESFLLLTSTSQLTSGLGSATRMHRISVRSYLDELEGSVQNSPTTGSTTVSLGLEEPAQKSPTTKNPSVSSILQESEFQLEEFEDQDTSITGLFLNRDGTVSVSETTGPLFSSATGNWKAMSDTDFIMCITRTFRAFGSSYSVDRDYIGEFEQIVDNKAILGGKIIMGGDSDVEVGFFKLICSNEDYKTDTKDSFIENCKNFEQEAAFSA